MSHSARPAGCRVRAGVGDTRVSGASFRLAEGASQKPLYGIRTRGSQRPDDSQGRRVDMAQERGAFKVNRISTPLPAPPPTASNLDMLTFVHNSTSFAKNIAI